VGSAAAVNRRVASTTSSVVSTSMPRWLIEPPAPAFSINTSFSLE